VILSRWVTRFSLGRGLLPLVFIPALHGRPFPAGLHPLSPCLHNVSAFPVICFPEPLFALSHMHYITQHCTHRLLATLCCPPGLYSAATSVSECSAVTAWHGLFLWDSLHSPEHTACKGMALPHSVFLVLGAARAVVHNSYLRLSEYGNAVL
jgi:hypothetical protein